MRYTSIGQVFWILNPDGLKSEQWVWYFELWYQVPSFPIPIVTVFIRRRQNVMLRTFKNPTQTYKVDCSKCWGSCFKNRHFTYNNRWWQDSYCCPDISQSVRQSCNPNANIKLQVPQRMLTSVVQPEPILNTRQRIYTLQGAMNASDNDVILVTNSLHSHHADSFCYCWDNQEEVCNRLSQKSWFRFFVRP